MCCHFYYISSIIRVSLNFYLNINGQNRRSCYFFFRRPIHLSSAVRARNDEKLHGSNGGEPWTICDLLIWWRTKPFFFQFRVRGDFLLVSSPALLTRGQHNSLHVEFGIQRRQIFEKKYRNNLFAFHERDGVDTRPDVGCARARSLIEWVVQCS